MLGHFCLINDNSEMNNNQSNIQTIFLILLFQALIFLFQVNQFFLNFCQTIKSHPSKQMPVQTQQQKLFGVFIVKVEYKVFLLLTLNKQFLVGRGNRLNYLKRHFHNQIKHFSPFLESVTIWYPLNSKPLVFLFFRGYKIEILTSERLVLE